MLTIRKGDIFQSHADALVNPVNCVGVMGKGLALEFKKRYPYMFRYYGYCCKCGRMKIGTPLYVLDDDVNMHCGKRLIVLFPTKNHWREKSQLSYIEECLNELVATYKYRNAYNRPYYSSIAFPALGCGLGGLDWHDVVSIMVRKLVDLQADVEIYEP